MNRILKQIKKLLYCLFFLAVIAIVAYNVSLNKKSTDMAKLTLANITTLANAEELAGESNKKGYDQETQTSEHSMNGEVYKKSGIVTCYKGGPNSSCTSSCKYKLKNDDGSWTSWKNC
jgi:hypothetical protein